MNMQPELQPVRSNAHARRTFGTAIPAEWQNVLRNACLLLALTMVPTIAGAYLGIATASVLIQHPISTTFVMLAAVFGLQFAIVANRNSVVGVALLLLMTGLLGWFLGPMLNYALALRNGAHLIGYAAGGTALGFLVLGAIATHYMRDFSFMVIFLFVCQVTLLNAM